MASTVTAQPSLLDGETVPASDLRAEITGAMFDRPGVVRGLAAVALPTPDMRVRLPAGLCMIDDGQGGYYPLSLTTQTDLDVAASSATLARYDSVIAEVVDTGSVGTLIRRFRVVTGTPASSPTPPALPYTDQPTAKTLRIANVYVQANAEVNGKVRAQDVTVVADQLSAVARPMQSLQIVNITNPAVTAGTWNDFTPGQWPPITLTAPRSGMMFVTVGANCENTASDTATVRTSFRVSGGYTQAADFGRETGGHLAATGSRRYLINGMTPGATVTVTPAFRLSSIPSGSASALVNNGNLIVEPI